MRDKAQTPTNTDNVTYTSHNTSVKNTLTFEDSTIVVPVHCRYDYCNSQFFNKLPYGVLQRYKDDIYKLIFYHKLKYSTDIYIETTEHNMRVFSSFLKRENNVQNKSFVGGLME